MEKTIFDYDPVNDSLFISHKSEHDRVKGSIVQDNISLDFTEDGRIVGIEIIGISGYLDEWGFDSEILNNIQEAKLIIHKKKGFIVCGIMLNGQKIPLGLLPLNEQIIIHNQ